MPVLRSVITFLTIIFIINSAPAQSLYQLQYNFQKPGDTITYHAFLVLYDDGGGILRLRYQQNDQDIVMEADAMEQPIVLAPGVTDSIHTFYSFSNQRVISGKPVEVSPLPLFYFNTAEDGFIQPSAVVPSTYTNLETDKAQTFTAGHIEMAALRKNFLLQYFSEDEEFYQSIFYPVNRGLNAIEKNTRIHLLIIANTNDKLIGTACGLDKDRTLQTFTDLAGYLGIRLISDTISGKIYNKKNAEAAIKKLNPSANDIVVFYYSGHGYRKNGQQSRFPLIDLRAKPSDDYVKESLAMEDIYKRIKGKRARISLVLSDCCNNEVTQTNVFASKPLKTKGSGMKWKEENVRNLFLNTTALSILATAADAGQKATCNKNIGGFFSWYLKISMETYCSVLKNNPTWDEVLQLTHSNTLDKARHTYCAKPYIPENICTQSPVYKIEIGR
ncbi:MAG TPA: caspase family protein [Ferruginibacter sp.]|nr:caspase family protein [Ferruginibacter sp.]